MAIPHLDQIRRPALKLLAERETLTKVGEIFDLLAPEFNLTEEDRHEMLPSGTQRKWNNRVNWSCFDLYKAKLLDRPKKGFYKINDAGHKALFQTSHEITRKDLSELSEAFKDFVTPTQPGKVDPPGLAFPPALDEDTPEERIDMAMQSIDSSLRSELLDHLAKVDPYRFEQVVVDLLFAMGYGGSREEAARVTKKSGDEGIDGVINEDRLGLDVIYVQAKRWQNVVGRKEIQSFVGALAGQQANKGVFITTSDFTQNAIQFAKGIMQKVVLIDGLRLAELMIEHDVGVSTTRTISIKRIDSDYFEET
jgi:restriction system protein